MEQHSVTLSEIEEARLSFGGLVASQVLGPALVSVQLAAAPCPSIAWINTRWFVERGLDLTSEQVRARLENWLIHKFALTIFKSEVTELPVTIGYVDRYGSTDGLSPHGGSGRAAIIGSFQVKGVGPTPMVGVNEADGHAHGCLSLAEALREAVYSEVVANEFPYGAVPAIAVIRMNQRYSSPDHTEKFDRDVQRGLLVRPFVVRPAHIERAPCFRGQDVRREQQADVVRVRHVVLWWEDQVRKGISSSVVAPVELFHRMGRQIGFGQAHRLFNGGYFSSNISATGALLDFGNAHWFLRWHKSKVLPHAPGFLDEMNIVRKIAHSLEFYFRHYGKLSICAKNMIKAAESGLAAEKCKVIKYFCLEDSQRNEKSKLDAVFKRDSMIRVSFAFGKPMKGKVTDESIASTLIREMSSESCSPRLGETSISMKFVAHIDRLLGARYALDRAGLMAALHELVGATSNECVERIGQSTTRIIGLARRHWPQLPEKLVVLRHTSRDGSSALLCWHREQRAFRIWIQGVFSESRFFLFDKEVDPRNQPGLSILIHLRTWSLCVSEDCLTGTGPVKNLTIGGRMIALPPWSVSYVGVSNSSDPEICRDASFSVDRFV